MDQLINHLGYVTTGLSWMIHVEHGGVAVARNIGLDNINGSYFSFVDSDDWVESNMYNEMLDDLEKNQVDGNFYNHTIRNEAIYEIIKEAIANKEGICNIDTAMDLILILYDQAYFSVVLNKIFRTTVLVSCILKIYDLVKMNFG